jgi:hypothetical protein
MKHIIGVSHSSQAELDAVVIKISQDSPAILGLELPENYLEMRKRGFSSYFHEMAKKLEACMKIIPLEDSVLFHVGEQIDRAKAVVADKRYTRNEVESEYKDLVFELDSFDRKYASPEIISNLEYQIDFLGSVLNIIDTHPTHKAVMELWQGSNLKREEHMLKVIKEENPEIVVIGDGHARVLKNSLPEYQYLKFIG